MTTDLRLKEIETIINNADKSVSVEVATEMLERLKYLESFFSVFQDINTETLPSNVFTTEEQRISFSKIVALTTALLRNEVLANPDPNKRNLLYFTYDWNSDRTEPWTILVSNKPGSELIPKELPVSNHNSTEPTVKEPETAVAESTPPMAVLVIFPDDALRSDAALLVNSLRGAGIEATLEPTGSGTVKSQLKYAEKLGVRLVAILDSGTGYIKLMDRKVPWQENVSSTTLLSAVKKRLSK